MADIKAYKPESNSIGSGQVLQSPYEFEKAKLVVREMTELLVLDLVEKNLVTNQLTLTVGYDIENLSDPERRKQYHGPVTTDQYGRSIPKHAHGTENLDRYLSSTKLITEAMMNLFDRIVDPKLLVRRITITANRVIDEKAAQRKDEYEQLDLFTDYEAEEARQREEQTELEREKECRKLCLILSISWEECDFKGNEFAGRRHG